MSELLTPIAYQLGAGGILGLVVGYAIKKVAKLLMVLAGIFVIILMYLGYQGIINVNYGKLAESVEGMLGGVSSSMGWLTHVISNLPFAGAFTAGMVLGIKIG